MKKTIIKNILKNKDKTDLIGIINSMADYILYSENGFIKREEVINYFYLSYLFDDDFSF